MWNNKIFLAIPAEKELEYTKAFKCDRCGKYYADTGKCLTSNVLDAKTHRGKEFDLCDECFEKFKIFMNHTTIERECNGCFGASFGDCTRCDDR